jgi:nucleoside-diphosphate-sugar epimerase
LIQQLLSGKLPGLARIQFSCVDVRDVASAHLTAMTTPEAASQRFLCVAEQFWVQEAADILNKHFGSRGYKVRTTLLPSWVVHVVALFNKSVRPTLRLLDKETYLDTSHIRKTLNWKPRNLEEMIVSMAESLIELKMV